MNKIIQTNIKLLYVIFYSKRSKESINEKQGPTKEHIYVGALMDIVRTRFDLDPTQEWIQAHVAQTMNL